MTNFSSPLPTDMSPSNSDLEMNLVDVIETVISSLDAFDNALVHSEGSGHLWTFTYGSAEVWVQLTGSTEEDTLSVWAPVLQLPVTNQDKLFEKLMALNWRETLEAHFATFQTKVVVLSTRSIADLNVGEISHLITLVASLADDYDDELQQDFSAFTS